MTPEELKKLRGYYLSLLGQKKVFDRHGAFWIDRMPVAVLQRELGLLAKEFPNLIEEPDWSGSYSRDGKLVICAVVRGFLSSVLGKLRAEIDASEANTILQKQDFKFVLDPAIRKILERDYDEIQRALVSCCWKSVIILAGSTIEAILLDLLKRHEVKAKASTKAPTSKPDLTRWDLADLISVCVDLKLISGGVENLSNSVRGYRNLIHPGNEIRNQLKFDAGEAKIAFEVLGIVCRDLS